MLNLDQDTFITQYVTTFLATRGAQQYADARIGNLEAGVRCDAMMALSLPVRDAMMMARIAWYRLLEQGAVNSFTSGWRAVGPIEGA